MSEAGLTHVSNVIGQACILAASDPEVAYGVPGVIPDIQVCDVTCDTATHAVVRWLATVKRPAPYHDTVEALAFDKPGRIVSMTSARAVADVERGSLENEQSRRPPRRLARPSSATGVIHRQGASDLGRYQPADKPGGWPAIVPSASAG
jgi:hypothetical protein